MPLSTCPWPTRRALLLAAASSRALAVMAQGRVPLRVAVPDDVAYDYAMFLGTRNLLALRHFGGAHARRDVTELALLLREVARSLPGSAVQLVRIDSYQRALLELRAGRVDVLGTTVWGTDLLALGTNALPSPALIADGDFVVGLYTAPDNTTAQKARTLAALQTLRAVSNSDWSADWRTLQALGMRSVMDVKTWRQMVLAVARGRADVLLAPFPATPDLMLDAEGQRLVPLQGRTLALMGARHLAAATTPAGREVAEKVFPALAALVASGAVRRAYQACGFYNPRTNGWTAINGKTRP
ncbi:MAG: hypothetical protein K2X79_11265 [Burkholderiaceae bacterium]|nr:hypothetical protein [Burkholderiaceae bacterium]